MDLNQDKPGGITLPCKTCGKVHDFLEYVPNTECRMVRCKVFFRHATDKQLSSSASWWHIQGGEFKCLRVRAHEETLEHQMFLNSQPKMHWQKELQMRVALKLAKEGRSPCDFESEMKLAMLSHELAIEDKPQKKLGEPRESVFT